MALVRKLPLRAGRLLAALLLCVFAISGLIATPVGPAAAEDENATGGEASDVDTDPSATETTTRILSVATQAGEDMPVADWAVVITSPDGSIVHAEGEGQAQHTVTDGESYRLAQAAPESYAVESLQCESAGVIVPLATGPDADGAATIVIPLEGEDDIVCVYTYAEASIASSGMLTVSMTADGAVGQDFGFLIVGAASSDAVHGFLLADGESAGPVVLAAGTYHLLQTNTPIGAPGAWELTHVACEDGDTMWNPAVDATMPDHWQISLDIASGADVVCDLHVGAPPVPEKGSVVVVKHEVGNVSAYRPWVFNLGTASGDVPVEQASVSPVSLLVANLDTGQLRQLHGAGLLSFQEVEPGEFTLSEINGSAQRCESGDAEFETLWGFSDDVATASFGTETDSFTVGPGERVEVHFFNRACDDKGEAGSTLVIGKVNIGGDPLSTFSVSIAGVVDALTFSAAQPATVAALDPGDYVVTEAPAEGHLTMGWAVVKGGDACPSEPQHSGPVAKVSLENGSATVLCFYNEAGVVPPGDPPDVGQPSDEEPVTPLPPSTGSGLAALGIMNALMLTVVATVIGLGAGAAADALSRRRIRWPA